MCIIATYPAGVRPAKQEIINMIERNPDGVGIAWAHDLRVHVLKGLADEVAVSEIMDEIIPADAPILFHARIATSGGISAGVCHPYPITAKPAKMRETFATYRVPVLAHNGILHDFAPEKTMRNVNDSMLFNARVIYPLYHSRLAQRDRDNIITSALGYGNKIAILEPCGIIRHYGRGWTKTSSGARYSNDSYKKYTPPKYSYTTYDQPAIGFGAWYSSTRGDK